MKRNVNGPFFLYFTLGNFYANTRAYRDASPDNWKIGACHTFRTVGEVFNFRPRSSFPELANKSDNDPFIPCGLQSAAYFNDEIVLQQLSCDEEGMCDVTRNLTITSYPIAPRESMTLYAHQKVSDWTWTDPLRNERLQAWYHTAFTPKMNIPRGTLKDFGLERGHYRVFFTQNGKIIKRTKHP